MNLNYLSHLCRDRRLRTILEGQEPIRLRRRKNVFSSLCASIISQQLSTRVADVIFQRFLDLYGGQAPLAEQVLDTAPEQLRAIGLSAAKVQYILNAAQFEVAQGMGARKLAAMDNEVVINYLTQIKGVGRWTVEMLLMFTLGREDVFAVDDLGIQQAMGRLYKIDLTDKKKTREAMLRISAKWSPYRTYACLHLWRWKDEGE